MRVHRWYRRGCVSCKAKTGTLTIWRVHPAGEWEQTDEPMMSDLERCVNGAACAARKAKRQDRARLRATLLVLEEPKAPNAPAGTCTWCGEPIVFTDDAKPGHRRRCYHRGDEVEATDLNCLKLYNRSRCWDGRTLIEYRGDPCCVDCGSEGPWEADHEVALEDGGEHCPENLKRRCDPCHRRKTGRENSARLRAGAAPANPDQEALAL